MDLKIIKLAKIIFLLFLSIIIFLYVITTSLFYQYFIFQKYLNNKSINSQIKINYIKKLKNLEEKKTMN